VTRATPGLRAARAAVLAALALLAPGCFTARYVAQAARGQLGILQEARPLEEVVGDRDAPPRVRSLLLAVPAVKAFGEAHGLRPTQSYGRYADVRRPAAVWVVQACAPLAFESKHWRLPIVGTIPYLGFFDPRAARRYADALAAEGLDVNVRAAAAYSTLGWFPDPVLSTMIVEGDDALGELANVVLHESVHATIYVNDQSPFNESLASFVADRLTVPWLERARGRDAPETRAWVEAQARRRARLERLHRARAELDALYRSAATDDEKRARKARILADVSTELRLVRPLNNATLAGIRMYDAGTAAFARLLDAAGGSVPRLLRAVATLRPSDFARPQQQEFDDVVDALALRTRAGRGRQGASSRVSGGVMPGRLPRPQSRGTWRGRRCRRSGRAPRGGRRSARAPGARRRAAWRRRPRRRCACR
jgi:predicted aminopeptidase